MLHSSLVFGGPRPPAPGPADAKTAAVAAVRMYLKRGSLIQLEDPHGIFPQELRPDLILEGHLRHVAEDALQGQPHGEVTRSEERRVGKECRSKRSTCE